MRILLLAEDFYPNTSGGAHVRWRFSELCAERDHDIVVYTPRREDTPAEETVNGVEIRRPYKSTPESLPAYLSLAFPLRILFSVRLLLHLLFSDELSTFDGIHSASNTLHWVAKLLAMRYRLPLVNFVGYTPSLDPDIGFSPKLIFEWLTFRYCLGDVTFCRTPQTRDRIRSLSDTRVSILHGILHEEKIRRIGESIPSDEIRDQYDSSEEENLLVFVGRMTPVKNPFGALEVVSRLPSQYRLLFVGDGTETEVVRSAVTERGLEDRVDFSGLLPHRRTLHVIATADALLVTSRTESYSAVALEALALETPVFSTPVGVLPEIEHEKLRLGTVSELPRLVEDARFDGQGSLDRTVLEEFSMGRYTDEILTTFEQLLDE
ncbi:glycosyltransferase family 4 protein [Halorussus ruber]|uniref:glycosyltransferase family 4 protein n=1 Tax=Halorussus ruber TaxID=1126238 RepID=UPI001091AE37|nr:glycosyltransferase family 4 protein [Halorussus ruber]